MEGLFTLLILSMVMALISFTVGSLPLSLSLSPSQFRIVSSLGMGILVGTALTVIIPEGIETLYSSVGSHTQHHSHTRALDLRGLHSEIPVAVSREPVFVGGGPVPEPDIRTAVPQLVPKSADEALDKDTRDEDTTEPTQEEEADDQAALHAWVGVALISGFVLMYLIDKLPEFAAPAKPKRPTHHISLDNLGGPTLRRSASPNTNAGLLEPEASSRNHSIATTLGLVIHAVADGIALGASGSNASLGFIIFFALLVHKAPASFGLTSVLLKQGLSNRLARAHLLVFSLAAPVGAILTFILVHAFGSGPEMDENSIRWRTGVVLLFSAGTFLYVAMHTMHENAPQAPAHEGYGNGYAEIRDSSNRRRGSVIDLAASVAGMVLPLFLQIGHAH